MPQGIPKEKLFRSKWVSGGNETSLPPTTHLVFREPTAPCPHDGGPVPALPRPGAGLTYEICQQNGQEERRGDGRQGGTFPAAVLGGLLQLEGLPGEGIPGQQAGRRRVDGPRGQRVPGRRAAEQGRASGGGLKEKVPARRRGESDGRGWRGTQPSCSALHSLGQSWVTTRPCLPRKEGRT